MRVIVLALAVAVAAGSQANLAPEFDSDKTYEYSYEARLMGGLPEEGLARAGVKIHSTVLIHKANNVILLKLSDPEISEYSGIWPKDAFSPDSKITSALANQLTAPIKFEYANGLVGRVFAPAGISATVLNIYRGILNILQMSIKKNQNFYDLQEPGSQGVCKTHYIISEDKKDGSVQLIKTRDLGQCQNRIYKNIGLAYTHSCPDCEVTGKSLKGASTFSYNMKPTAQGSLITMATAKELIQYSPFNILKGAAQMEAMQTMKFIRVSKTPLEPQKVDYLHRGSLQYEFSTELLQMPVQLLRINNAATQMVEILNHLVNFNVATVHEDAPLKFIEFIQVLRVAQPEAIEALWTKFKARPDYRNWILNAIPAIGTHTAVRFIKEKFIADELTVAEAAQALIASVHMVTADIESLRLFESLVVQNKVLDSRILRDVVMLGYGTLVSKYCVANPSCPAELMRPIHDYILSAVTKGRAEEIIVAVKAVGNAGHPGSLKSLMRLLPNFGAAANGLPHRVHIETALALRNIAKREPRMVQNIAMQLFQDKTNHADIRMVATVVLFEMKLPMGMVISLANSLLKEGNLQVASFVYSYMKAMTKSTTPDHVSVAVACNVAMRILSPKLNRLSHRYSRALYYDAYQSPWMMGAAASAFYINEAATVLPKALLAKARTYLAGAYADVLEIGVRTEGVQEAMLKMKDQNGQRIDKIKQIVQALVGWRASPSSPPLASLYVKLFGQEIAFANIDKAVVNQVLEFGPEVASYGRKAWQSLLSGIKMHWVKPMLVAEIRHIFPTTVGLPMELSFYTAGVAAASVECQGMVAPPLPKDFKASQLLDSDINIKAAIAPSVSFHTYAVMGVNTAFIQAALLSRAKVHTVIPAKVQAKMNVMKGNFKFELLPVQGIDKIASALVDTYAVARNIEDITAARLTPLLPSQISLDSKWSSSTSADSKSSESISGSQFVANQTPVKRYDSKMCKEFQTYGIKACTEIESHNAAFIRNCPLYAIIGRHAVSIQVARASGPLIENIEIEIQVGDKAAEKVLKTVNLSDEEEALEDKTVLMKLQKILTPGLKNANSSSSSSSRSSASKSSSSSSSRPTSKMVNGNNPFHKRSKKSSSSSRSSVWPGNSSGSRSRSSSGSSSSSSSSSSRSSRSSRSSSRSSRSSRSRSSSSSGSKSSSSRSYSRSSSRSKSEQTDCFEAKFTKDHIHKPGHNSRQSKSSASSFEAIYNKARYLANTMHPYITIILRAVRSDSKLQGYQVTAYIDKQDRRVQIIVVNLAEHENWRMCADAVLLSNHKMNANLAWGENCKQYQMILTAETGVVANKPAYRVKMSWKKIPHYMKWSARKFLSYMLHMSCDTGIKTKKAKNTSNQVAISVAFAYANSLSFQLMTPKRTISKCDIQLPVYLPYFETATELQVYDNWLNKLFYILSKSSAVECTVLKDKIITFNRASFKTELPHSCTQVLVQDCSQELKFLVMMKRDHTQDQNQINVKIADLDIDMYNKNNAVELKVNGMPFQISNQIYQHPTGHIHMRQRGEGVALYAPFYGLQKIYFDLNVLKVEVVDWMKGQTCGLCGKADGEVRQEFRMPSGRVANSAISYAHSWVEPGKSCRDSSGCLMKYESVKLEKQMLIEGQESKCFSVEPVLRCLPGCMPVRTTQVNIGFHCVPADTNLNRSEIQSSMFDKSVDVKETAEAHLACRCSIQCP